MHLKNQSFSIILLSTAVALIGVLFVPYISINLNPDYQYPSMTISTSYGNSSPEEVERQITRPIESLLSTLHGITKMYSRSNNGGSFITLSLNKRVDVDIFRFQVLSLLRQVHQSLPIHASMPTITSNKPGDEKSFSQILTYS
ncbi:MAG TPA: efflux RND transporter permease subunit, partial [Saprospiraceae bacterium]|nr:efflux RND transporter permease subunit [Saprospiraceae bacterium]